MNRYIADSFESMKKAATEYRQSVICALRQFRATKEQAEQYKDESGHIEAAKVTARNTIALAENAFTGTIKGEIESLKAELGRHLLTAPSEKFLSALNVYFSFGIAPGKPEIEALLERAAGNPLSLRALNSVLEKTGSDYRIEFPGAEDFEKDISALELMAEGHLLFAPADFPAEISAIFGGTPRMTRLENGEYIDRGNRWDAISIITASNAFDRRIKDLDDMSARWTDAVLPTIFIPAKYPEGLAGAMEFVEDYASTKDAAQIVDDDRAGFEATKQRAQARAETLKEAGETVARYAGE